MIKKINKYSFIILLMFLFLFFNNSVEASMEEFGYTYNDKNYSISFDNDGSVNTFFVICNKSTGVPEKFIYHYSDNSFKYYYNEQGNLVIQKMDNDSYFYLNPKKTGDNTYLMQWGGFKREDLTIDVNKSTICYSNKSILHKDTNTDLFSKEETFKLEYNEKLKSYVVYSQWYGITDNELYAHQHYYQINPSSSPVAFVSNIRDFEGWSNMEGEENLIGPGAEFNEENEKIDMDVEKVRWRVGMQILNYGTYYFCHYLPLSDNKDYEIVKFVITETGEAYTETRNNNSLSWSNKQNITDISTVRDNITNLNSYDNFEVFYTENYSNAFIYTNWFLSDNNYIYKVDYSIDEVNWNNSMNVEEYTSTFDYFRYTLDVVNNGSYYIRLIILDSNDNSIVKTKVIKIDIRNIGVVNYDSNDSNVVYSLKNNFVYHFFKNSLGALFYPVDILFDFLDRIDKIGTSNPTIVVPTVREYFTDAVIINGFTFSLDDVLENEIFANVYTIYLNVVDFILFMFLLSYIYNVFKDFTNFGGGII